MNEKINVDTIINTPEPTTQAEMGAWVSNMSRQCAVATLKAEGLHEPGQHMVEARMTEQMEKAANAKPQAPDQELIAEVIRDTIDIVEAYNIQCDMAVAEHRRKTFFTMEDLKKAPKDFQTPVAANDLASKPALKIEAPVLKRKAA